VDYADLPGAVWQRVAPHFGIEVDSVAIERMAEQSRYYSKDAEPQQFSAEQSEARPITEEMTETVERFAGPGYRQLAESP